jgi:deoxyadenosine/deoxycytidine kinase
MNNIRILSIEGNIGSGKSTIIKYLRSNLLSIDDKYKIIFVDEPVSSWEKIKDSNDKNMIEKFYENPQKYAFAFQIMAFTTRFIYLKNAIDEALTNNLDTKIIIITERSLHTDCYVFAELLRNQGNIEDVCFQIYMQMFDEFSVNYPINTLIYVNTNPKICYDRIKQRSRSGEEIISLDYLTQCHEEHEKYIYTKMTNSNKILIDGTIDINENPEILDEWLKIIKYHMRDMN